MTDYKQTPDRPEGWRLNHETRSQKLERDKRNYDKAWSMFRDMFRNQDYKDVTNRSARYSPPMEQIDFNNQTPNL